MRLRLLLYFSFLLICGLHAAGQDFLQNNYFSPSEIAQAKLTAVGKKRKEVFFSSPLSVFVLLSPECPLCKNYSTVLNKINGQFSGDLSVYGIVPGKAYSAKEINKFIKDYKINFPVYVDSKKELTTYIEGTVTPEVILMNQQGEVIYRGAIDDWVSDLGKKKLVVSNEYLKTAIKQYLQNQTVSIKSVEPIGCLINEF
jgi:thiol-disulfide isomerase/thioredoxin